MLTKNIALGLSAILFIAFVLGCGLIGRNSAPAGPANNAAPTSTDRTTESVATDQSVGIPECDDVLAQIETELNDPNDGYAAKAVKEMILNRLKEAIRQSIDESGATREEKVQTCREFKVQFEKFKAEQRKASAEQP